MHMADGLYWGSDLYGPRLLPWIEQHKGKEDLTEYGSTFLLVLMEKKTGESVLVNLGDGAAISEKDHRLQYLMEPRRINGDTCLTTTKGAEQVMEIETKRIALGECVILGSDGFLEMTTDEQIYEALKERNLEQLNQKLQDAKNMDDCSYIAFVREKE